MSEIKNVNYKIHLLVNLSIYFRCSNESYHWVSLSQHNISLCLKLKEIFILDSSRMNLIVNRLHF